MADTPPKPTPPPARCTVALYEDKQPGIGEKFPEFRCSVRGHHDEHLAFVGGRAKRWRTP